jgi:putative phage-type endonuclease
VKLLTFDSREEWLAARAEGLGATDVVAVLGESRFASPWSVWAEKCLHISGDAENEDMTFGRYAEKMVAPWFQDRTGLYVIGAQGMAVHDDIPWAFATLDGFVVESPHSTVDDMLGTIEIKAPREWKAWDDIPVAYKVQASWQMFVTGAERCWFAVLHGRRLGVYEYQRDQADIDFIVAKVTAWWEAHCLTGNPPKIDGSEATATALAEVWPVEVPGTRVDLDDLAERIEQRRKLKEAIKSVTAELDVIDNEIKAAMADDEIGCIDGVPVLTYRSVTVNRKPQPASTTTYRALKPATKKDLENA